MRLSYSQVIEKFGAQLGISKAIIEDTFNKPDKTDIVGGMYISIKYYGGHIVLVTFAMRGNNVNFENAYKIFPSMLTVDINKSSALEILKNFMETYGMEVEVPKVGGKHKIYIDEKQRIFFQGILDLEKYAAATKGS